MFYRFRNEKGSRIFRRSGEMRGFLVLLPVRSRSREGFSERTNRKREKKRGRMKGIVANNHWRRANLRRGSFVPRKSLLGHTEARIIVKPG